MNASDKPVYTLDAEEVEKVINIAKEVTSAQRTPFPKTKLERRLDSINRQIMTHALFCFIIGIAMAILAAYTKSRPLANTSIVLAFIVQLFGFLILGVVIFAASLFFWQFRKSRFGPFFELVKSAANMDFPFVLRLADCNKVAVQYVLTYYKYERFAFEKRGALLSGSIERVGLFPAMAGLILLITSLAKVPDIATWAVMLGPLIFAFYILNLSTFQMMQTMDRVIAVLEYSIQARKNVRD